MIIIATGIFLLRTPSYVFRYPRACLQTFAGAVAETSESPLRAYGGQRSLGLRTRPWAEVTFRPLGICQPQT